MIPLWMVFNEVSHYSEMLLRQFWSVFVNDSKQVDRKNFLAYYSWKTLITVTAGVDQLKLSFQAD